ncbi:putative C6 transcription factor [Aspergillus steynii IBT 23096]|uniref:Putative C6 transcription factor n=1 Tax=Aspergillus steynii IBT 23096 TaxID=1392250 RepID=A0A2I2FUJ6_9EURO|nr:putative C6 transcription factor [Aspergillus steynii IBT 23096]PLB44294.1 putative C6 transcription factor [Aspergillus steynii IBT 23096]
MAVGNDQQQQTPQPLRQSPDDQDSGRYSQSSQGPKSPSLQPQHRRGYQACDPCRKRKVKCDLGSVDNPRPPPCVRCRRESKRCEFSATRRKRKPSEVEEPVFEGVLRRDKRMMVGEVVSNGSPSDGSSYTATDPTSYDNNTNTNSAATTQAAAGRPQRKWSEGSPSTTSQIPPATATQQPYQANASSATNFPDVKNTRLPMYPVGDRSSMAGFSLEGGQPMMNRTAVELLSPAISNSHDALHLLSEAAGRTEDLNRQSLENRYAARQSVSSFNSPISPLTQAGTPRSAGGSFSRPPRSGAAMGNYYQTGTSGSGDTQAADGRGQSGPSDNPQDPGYLDAVKAWSRLRFVRAGWLSVEESMAYVAYYYEHLAPLSPIVIPDFSHPSTHRTMLTDEPVLAVMILTTASRHMKPKGDGAYTRAFYIHDRLWSYLRGMIERLFWGQEKFGGNGMGINKPRSFDLAPTSAMVHAKGNLRSLGTIEALLILTDWHPRNLHFPPGDDENALLDVDAQAHSMETDGENGANRSSNNPAEGRLAFQKWLEPAWRSDRMSWMLMSTAQALAFELGVFDQKSESKSVGESPAEQTRKRRLRRLILVYITQSSGRLGIPSMLPLPQWANDIQPTTVTGAKNADTTVDRMHDCWIGISKIMYQSNQLLFASNEQTSELIRSGRYRDQIDRFQPFLREWRQNIDTIELAPAMRMILMIEYEYTRLYVNSLALQAVVDRWTTMSNEAAQAQARSGSGPSSSHGWFHVLMELYRVNEQYIQEVVDASRKILHTVLDGLVPGDHLKHAPVRTCFRILSGMIFILKTFTLGAKEDDVRVSLDLQDRTMEALRTNVVDDVHLSHAIARLLELLTTSIRTRFLRFAPLDRGGDGEAHDRTASAPVSRPQSPRPREGPQTRRDGSNNGWASGPNATHNIGYVDSNGQQTGGSMGSVHDPLAGIPAQPINSSNINVSFMPPPPSVYHNYYDPNTTPPAGGADLDSSNLPSQPLHDNAGASSGLPDWFALPLDQFFNSSTAVVDQGLGGTGPMVGDFDMLEVLLNEQYDGNGEHLDSAGGGNLSSQFLQS